MSKYNECYFKLKTRVDFRSLLVQLYRNYLFTQSITSRSDNRKDVPVENTSTSHG